MTGVLDEATETWVDLDDMLAADLPPCRLEVDLKGFPATAECGRPVAVVVRTKCSSCRGSQPLPVCREHHLMLLLGDAMFGGMSCPWCGAPKAITFEVAS